MIHLRALIPPAVGLGTIGVLLAGTAVAGVSAAPATSRDAVASLSSVTSAASATLTATEGGLSGGETVGIQGSGLGVVTSVSFGSQHAEVVSTSNSEVVVEVPPDIDFTPGEVPVSLGTAAGELSTELSWNYVVSSAVDRQLEYAFRHWNNYNLTYFGDFNVWGGDCMNFVSQTLLARGWGVTEDWFNNAQEDWAPAFVHVPSFDEWLSARPEYGAVKLTLDQRDQAKLGDIVVFDWDADGSLDHAQIISSVSADGSIAMVGHNLDTMYRDLDGALAIQGGPNAQAWIWSIP